MREKASTAILTVINGTLSARQIEVEFRRIVAADIWKWNAKQIAENKFTMRFLNSKMVLDCSQFKLGMKTSNIQLLVEPWSSAVGAKGQLQQAWFRVRGIPTDQRNLRTIAKIGGLVGKTVMIDEKTRYNPDFVRLLIACIDVLAVPEIAESSLGIYLYDFYFELEEGAGQMGDGQSSGVKVQDNEAQPSSKKQKMDHQMLGKDKSASDSSQKEVGDPKHHHSRGYGGDIYTKLCTSSHGKVNLTKGSEKGKNPEGMSELKGGNNELPKLSNMDMEEAIPAATYEPSDSSDDFQTQVNRVLGNDTGSSKPNNIWLARCDQMEPADNPSAFFANSNVITGSTVKITELNSEGDPISTEIQIEGGNGTSNELDVTKVSDPSVKLREEREDRRHSQRLQEKLVLPVKNTGKKRSSEGNSPNINSFSCLDTAYIIARSIGMGVNLGNMILMLLIFYLN